MNRTIYNTIPFLAIIPLAIELPAIQHKGINVLKPPKYSHVVQNITQFVKTKKQSEVRLYTSTKVTQITKLQSIITGRPL
jgi:hypothetical protein